jgi:adenosylcobinamide-GDP ribazoletransferase
MSLRALRVALEFLTRLPLPPLRDVAPRELGQSAAWFPPVGALVGGAVGAALWAGVHIGPWVGALAALVVWVLITGALHLDGLGDVADGLGAGHREPARFLEVVRDPHAGGFAVVAIGLQLLAKLVLLAELAGGMALAGLVLVPAWARWGAIVLGLMMPPLGAGLGARFAAALSKTTAAVWALVLGVASLWVAWPLLGALLISPLLALYWRRRLGGITGDCHGASIEITETLLLALLIVFEK